MSRTDDRTRPDAGRLVAVGLDLATLALFVVIGRASHHHGETVTGFLSTVWPFAAGAAAGWLVTRGRQPLATLTGTAVCVVTVALGMLFRVVAGQGTALPFIGVALAFTALCMIGGRVVLRRAIRRQQVAARSTV